MGNLKKNLFAITASLILVLEVYYFCLGAFEMATERDGETYFIAGFSIIFFVIAMIMYGTRKNNTLTDIVLVVMMIFKNTLQLISSFTNDINLDLIVYFFLGAPLLLYLISIILYICKKDVFIYLIYSGSGLKIGYYVFYIVMLILAMIQKFDVSTFVFSTLFTLISIASEILLVITYKHYDGGVQYKKPGKKIYIHIEEQEVMYLLEQLNKEDFIPTFSEVQKFKQLHEDKYITKEEFEKIRAVYLLNLNKKTPN